MGLSVPISSSSSATSGNELGSTITGVTFGTQYASPSSALSGIATSLSGSTLGIVLLGGGALIAFLLYRKYA